MFICFCVIVRMCDSFCLCLTVCLSVSDRVCLRVVCDRASAFDCAWLFVCFIVFLFVCVWHVRVKYVCVHAFLKWCLNGHDHIPNVPFLHVVGLSERIGDVLQVENIGSFRMSGEIGPFDEELAVEFDELSHEILMRTRQNRKSGWIVKEDRCWDDGAFYGFGQPTQKNSSGREPRRQWLKDEKMYAKIHKRHKNTYIRETKQEMQTYQANSNSFATIAQSVQGFEPFPRTILKRYRAIWLKTVSTMLLFVLTTTFTASHIHRSRYSYLHWDLWTEPSVPFCPCLRRLWSFLDRRLDALEGFPWLLTKQ